MIHHGQLYQRDQVPPRSKYHDQGRFGRLFPTLPPFAPVTPGPPRSPCSPSGPTGGPMDAQEPRRRSRAPTSPDNPRIPSGFTFLGQFIDHDITFDPTSSLQRQNDPEALPTSARRASTWTVYGRGPGATSPYLYDAATAGASSLLGTTGDRTRALPTRPAAQRQGTALIGDPRNDENLIVSQLHLAFLKFHNAVVDRVRRHGASPPTTSSRGQRLVRWHYQWIVVHDSCR